jgi:hypothetical protein
VLYPVGLGRDYSRINHIMAEIWKSVSQRTIDNVRARP